MTIPILTVLAGFLAFLSGTMALSIYLTMRPGGLVESIIARRSESSDATKQSVTNLRTKVADLTAEVETLEAVVDKKVALLGNRMTAFETRAGKRSKKEEVAELQEEIFNNSRHAVSYE